MTPVWLYASDGRALYCVYVQTPMPKVLTYGGKLFAWNSADRQYVEYQPITPQAVPQGQESPKNVVAANVQVEQ